MEVDFSIVDTAFDPDSDQNFVYRYIGSDGKTRYKVWLYITGNYVPFIDYVVYTLHSTFQNPKVKISRKLSNQNCMYSIWTWGIFTMQAEIHLKTGEVINYNHYMSYDQEFKNRKPIFRDPVEPIVFPKRTDSFKNQSK